MKLLSHAAVQVVINLKLRSYCLVSCPNPPSPARACSLARLKSFSVIHPIYVIPVACNPRFHPGHEHHHRWRRHRSLHGLTSFPSLPSSLSSFLWLQHQKYGDLPR